MSVYSQSNEFHKAAVHYTAAADDDDWDTDPNYVNDVSERDQRKGSKIQRPEEDSAAIDLKALKDQVLEEDSSKPRAVHQSMKHTYGAH